MAGQPEQPLAGGWLSDAVRIGDTVHRATGPWTPAVHALLRHLEAKGFPYSPRVLGIDDRGREILTYIEGDAAVEVWPEAFKIDAGIVAWGQVLAEYHAAVADFMPPPGAVWRAGGALPLLPGHIVRHGDFAPWNTVWRDDAPAGIIDWDLAEPGPAIFDVAHAAWYGVPLHHQAEANLYPGADLAHRLRLFCDAAGGHRPADVLNAIEELQAIEDRRLEGPGAAGVEPWATFLRRGEREWLAACRDWLARNRRRLA